MFESINCIVESAESLWETMCVKAAYDWPNAHAHEMTFERERKYDTQYDMSWLSHLLKFIMVINLLYKQYNIVARNVICG